MFQFTDTVLSVMQRVEVYNEIFNSVSREVQDIQVGNCATKRRRDAYVFCRNNVVRFLMEEEQFRKNLNDYAEMGATQVLLLGLEQYKEGVYHWITALDESCEILDNRQYHKGLNIQESSFEIINKACKQACGGIESAHSVHKM